MRRAGRRRRASCCPGVGVQVPPNLADWWPELVAAGATDLGGLSANGDHISPEHPFPSPHQVRKRLAKDGVALTERLCVYPQYIDPEWVDQGVLDVVKTKYWSFIPRRGSGRTEPPRPLRPDLVAGAIVRARNGAWLEPDELTAMFAETRPEAIEDMRQAADDAARGARGRDGDVRRQPQHQRLERLHRRLRVLRLRPGQALARRLRARPRGVRPPRRRGGRLRRDRDLHAVGHPPRLVARGLPVLAAADQGDGAGHPRPRLQPDGDRAHVRHLRPAAGRGVRAAARGGARLDAGHGGRGAPRRRARADLAEQAAGRALGRDHRGEPPLRACARPRR